MTKNIGFALLAILCSGLSLAFSQARTEVMDFAPGGSLRFSLPVGDVRIVKGSDPRHIRLRYTPKSKKRDFADRVRLRFEVHGSEAEIEFNAPLGGAIDNEIEVPSPCNLLVKLSVGDLKIEGIEGNKNLRVHVGDINVDVGPRPNYFHVDVSTHIGDIGGAPFGEGKGWLGKSLSFHGDGEYRLHVHTGIGDVQFNSK